MKKVVNYQDGFIYDSNEKIIVIVKSATELISLMNDYPSELIKVRLVISSIDEELLNLLCGLNVDFEIVLQSNNIKESEVILLSRYKSTTNNKVYIAYNIDADSPYERAILIYYVNRYGIISLLSTKDDALYKEWILEMLKYTEKKNVKRLNRTYIG